MEKQAYLEFSTAVGVKMNPQKIGAYNFTRWSDPLGMDLGSRRSDHEVEQHKGSVLEVGPP